ncbi:MAG: FtsX-like permease family protein [Lachnospiraceae bacterium]|nr:FtsX-like permease family protein [Lachnospiraceae bacterium]
MQKVLRKRVLRDLKENWMRYLALGAMIILCMYIIISLIGTADTIITGSEQFAENNKLEDGQFTLFVPLTEGEKDDLEALGIALEEQFYLDYQLADDSTLRVFQDRELLNLVCVEQGRMAEDGTELVVEKRYAEEHELQIGSKLTLGDREFEVVGTGCSPDYDAPYKDFTDSSVNSIQFGTAFVSKEAYEKLLAEGKSVKAEEYVYAYRLADGLSDKELKEELHELKVAAEEIEDVYFQEYWAEQTVEKKALEDGIKELKDGSEELYEGLEKLAEAKTGLEVLDEGIAEARDGVGELKDGIGKLQDETDAFWEEHFELEISNLTHFLVVDDNPRAMAAAGDQVINKYGGLIAGAIILVLFAYVISVFVVYGIEKENCTIGALYALGVKQKELIRHYLCLPVVITFLAGTIGCALGFAAIGKSTIMGNCYSYFSIPQMDTIYQGYLLVYGILLPPVLSAVVNTLVIRKKLNKPALQMLRNEQKAGRASNVKLGNLSFITKFRIRQMLREARTSATVLGGMFISLLILMLGLDCYSMCSHISGANKADTKFEYMYTYKYPEEKVPAGGYEAFAKTMKKENLGYNLDVTILGITKENPFFEVELTNNKSEVVISSAMAEKYGIKAGEIVVLEDEETEMNYAFKVKDIVEYSTSFYVFMDIDCMRKFFGESETYFNQVFADKALDIEAGRLYAVTTKKDIEKAADVFINEMKPMITMMISVSALIFAVVMYLMMKVMIDRSAFHISMVKVFGYRAVEIKKLYLNGNFYVIAVGALVCIPLAKKCMDLMYPVMVSNVACSMRLQFSWQLYAIIYAGVLLVYLVINQLLVGRLHKVNLAEVLKNRE